MSAVVLVIAAVLVYHAAVITIGLHYARRGVVTVKRPPQPRPPKDGQP